MIVEGCERDNWGEEIEQNSKKSIPSSIGDILATPINSIVSEQEWKELNNFLNKNYQDFERVNTVGDSHEILSQKEKDVRIEHFNTIIANVPIKQFKASPKTFIIYW